MRQWKLFLSRFLLGLWIVLFSSFVLLLVFESRGISADVPIAEVSLEAVGSADEVAIPSRVFTCTEASSQTQCQVNVQDRPLVLTLTPVSPSSSHSSAYTCQATYDGRPVGCHSNDFRLGAMITETYQIRDIGFEAQQLEAVRQKYWGLNTLLSLGEVRLLKISAWLSVAGGLLTAYFFWTRLPNWFMRTLSLNVGIGIFLFTYCALFITLLGVGFTD